MIQKGAEKCLFFYSRYIFFKQIKQFLNRRNTLMHKCAYIMFVSPDQKKDIRISSIQIVNC